MQNPIQIRVCAQLPQLSTLQEHILDAVTTFCISQEQYARLRLLVEELFVNVCQHGERATFVSWVLQKTISAKGDFVLCTVIDDGKPFNPLVQNSAAMPMQTSSLSACPPSVEDREFGGLGIYFFLNLAHNSHYAYAQGENRLSFELSLQNS